LIRKINEEQGKQARTNIQIAGDVSKYPELVDKSKIKDPSLLPAQQLGKRPSRAGGHLPFKRDEPGEEKVKESKDLKDLKNRANQIKQKKLEGEQSSEEEDEDEEEEESEELEELSDEEDGSSYAERRESNKRRKLEGGRGKTLKRMSAIEEEEKLAEQPKRYESGSEEEYDPTNAIAAVLGGRPRADTSEDEFQEKPEQDYKPLL